MRIWQCLALAGALSVLGGPAFAQDTTGNMMAMDNGTMMMESGTVVTMMPDGQMTSTMMADDAMMGDMMTMGKPIAGCMMFMVGSDGKTYMMDTTAADAMAKCEQMAMNKPAM